MFRVSGTVRKGSKTAIYRHHFLMQDSLYFSIDVRMGFVSTTKILMELTRMLLQLLLVRLVLKLRQLAKQLILAVILENVKMPMEMM